MNIFFTSDTHFGHKNICGPNGFEEKRKIFKDTHEMDKAIIKSWNKVVNEEDTVYHLGDFFLHNSYRACIDIINQLNGSIVWIAGNHDSHKSGRRLENYFKNNSEGSKGKIKFCPSGERLIVEGYTLYLNHFGLLTGPRKKIFSVHGHIHAAKPMYLSHINVGIDNIESEFKDTPFGEPISLDSLLECVKRRESIMVENGTYSIYHNTKSMEVGQKIQEKILLKKGKASIDEIIERIESFQTSVSSEKSYDELLKDIQESLKDIQELNQIKFIGVSEDITRTFFE
ncbi:hypothetical protein A5882_003525 [Enterococcus sp. 4E1_DIV0656]|uniref:metallophosphoesterase n=1 Tax=Enterococcus sp. 4E1_DIV0656 TaxID=1834180 RepID=UPI000A3CC866|nr:metallophosphoesterase [Enterococcus sp. 4E1_DIV0656]OTO09195.1 hypothetical protein A5882_003525 [Enterococcus sp. 4E1_DIV0656]